MADLIIQRNKVWYAKCTFLGVRMRDSLKTTDKDQAVERLFELMLLVREGTYQYHATKFNDLAKKFEENPPLRDARNKLGVLRNHLMPAFKDKTLGVRLILKLGQKKLLLIDQERPPFILLVSPNQWGFPFLSGRIYHYDKRNGGMKHRYFQRNRFWMLSSTIVLPKSMFQFP